MESGAGQTSAAPAVYEILALVGMLAVGLIGAGFVALRDPLAKRLFPQATQALLVPDAQAVLFSVVGCYFALEGLSHFALHLAFSVFPEPLDWTYVAEFVLGVALFLGSRGLAGLWSRLRAAVTYAPRGDAPSN